MREQWAYEHLGPLFLSFIARLHAALSIRAQAASVQALFCTRAGARILHLLNLYLKDARAEPHYGRELFGGSRLLAAKSCFATMPEKTIEVLAREFSSYRLSKAVETICAPVLGGGKEADVLRKMFGDQWNWPVTPAMIDKLFHADNSVSVALQNWYRRECKAYREYVEGCLPGGAQPVIVDSGWQGTQQHLLMLAMPHLNWFGLMFGCLGGNFSPAFETEMRGLMFRASQGDVQPQGLASIALYHHLVEDLLEPPIASFASVGDLKELKNLKSDLAVRGAGDEHFDGVCCYFDDHVGTRFAEIESAAAVAATELVRIINEPTREEVHLARVRERSADFGKAERNAVVYLPDDDTPLGAEERMRRALWKAGQRALEAEGGARAAAALGPRSKARGSVAIITRTKDRAVLLKRAAASVAAQTYGNYEWVVVNDGGDPGPVEEVVARAGVDLRKVRIVHRTRSQGMEAASNAAIAASSASDYIVIHDDDDEWEPEFLEQTVGYLDNPPSRFHRGVIAGTLRASEVIVSDDYAEVIGSEVYNPWVKTVEISTVAQENCFAPIAFVFAREIYNHIGGFNESLPVLGDWDFNLRFLQCAEIGVLKSLLARYNHRDLQRSGAYSNSLTGALDKHVHFGALVRNDQFRAKPLSMEQSSGPASGAWIGSAMRDLKHHLNPEPHLAPLRDSIGAIQREVAGISTSLHSLNRGASAQAASVPGTASLAVARKRLPFSFRSARINDVHRSEQYSHVQIVLEEVVSPSGHFPWIDLRIANSPKRASLAVRNHGSNFRALLLPEHMQGAMFELSEDATVRLDGKRIGSRPSAADHLPELAAQALARAQNLEEQLGAHAQYWLDLAQRIGASEPPHRRFFSWFRGAGAPVTITAGTIEVRVGQGATPGVVEAIVRALKS